MYINKSLLVCNTRWREKLLAVYRKGNIRSNASGGINGSADNESSILYNINTNYSH